MFLHEHLFCGFSNVSLALKLKERENTILTFCLYNIIKLTLIHVCHEELSNTFKLQVAAKENLPKVQNYSHLKPKLGSFAFLEIKREKIIDFMSCGAHSKLPKMSKTCTWLPLHDLHHSSKDSESLRLL